MYRSVSVSTLLSLIVFATAARFNGPNFPDILTCGALLSSRKKNRVGTCSMYILESRQMKDLCDKVLYRIKKCSANLKIDCVYNCRKIYAHVLFIFLQFVHFLPRDLLLVVTYLFTIA